MMEYVDLDKIRESGESKRWGDRTTAEKIMVARTNRPDEWSMDDYARSAFKEAKKFEEKITSLESELSQAKQTIEYWKKRFYTLIETSNTCKGCLGVGFISKPPYDDEERCSFCNPHIGVSDTGKEEEDNV